MVYTKYHLLLIKRYDLHGCPSFPIRVGGLRMNWTAINQCRTHTHLRLNLVPSNGTRQWIALRTCSSRLRRRVDQWFVAFRALKPSRLVVALFLLDHIAWPIRSVYRIRFTTTAFTIHPLPPASSGRISIGHAGSAPAWTIPFFWMLIQ